MQYGQLEDKIKSFNRNNQLMDVYQIEYTCHRALKILLPT